MVLTQNLHQFKARAGISGAMPTMNGTAWSRCDGPDMARSPGLIIIGLATAVAGCHRVALTVVKVRRALADLCSDLGEMLRHLPTSGAGVRIAKREKSQSRR